MFTENPLYALIFFLCMSIMAWIFIGTGIYTARYQRRKEDAERAAASGRIVDLAVKKHRGRTTATYYVPVIEFTAGGTQYRLENENGCRTREEIVVGLPV